MSTTVLLAKNFIRQNRWLLLAFAVWPFMMGAFVWSPRHAAAWTEVSEIVQQELFYGLAVATFLTSSALYNEKRSRRIVGVLSKAVSRAGYLCGLLLGATSFAALYFLIVGASMLWLLGVSQVTSAASLRLLMSATAAAIWMSAGALLFSTFLHPFLAASLAGALGFAPLAFTNGNLIIAPVVALVGNLDRTVNRTNWPAVAASVIQSALMVVVAAILFAHRDVTVNIE